MLLYLHIPWPLQPLKPLKLFHPLKSLPLPTPHYPPPPPHLPHHIPSPPNPYRATHPIPSPNPTALYTSQERGTILTAFIVCYALTSALGGYVSGGLFARMEGRAWIQAMLLTACLYPGVIFSIGAVLNTIAIGYGSLAAVPFGYILIVLLLWAFLSLPLCVAGTLLGRNWGSAPNNPCRVKRIPSPIPPRPWYLSPAAIVAAGGLLPFGSIFIEMYFVFTSFFNYKV